MDKWKPTYDLGAFKTAFDHVDKINVTTVAVKSAIALGFTRQGIVDVIQTIQRGHFYKSMTSHRDHKVWQDVYHVPSEAGMLYVKFTADLVTDFLLLSFKEK